MIDRTVVHKVKERELPKALEQSYDFNSMNKTQAQSFHNRLRYIEEITLKIDEWLTAADSLEGRRAFIDRIELDLSINLSVGGDPEKEVSFWTVHSAWVAEVSAKEIKSALHQKILALLDLPIPGIKCGMNEFRAAIASWNEGAKIILDNFYSASSFAEAIALYIAMNIVLENMLVIVCKSRLSESVLK